MRLSSLSFNVSLAMSGLGFAIKEHSLKLLTEAAQDDGKPWGRLMRASDDDPDIVADMREAVNIVAREAKLENRLTAKNRCSLSALLRALMYPPGRPSTQSDTSGQMRRYVAGVCAPEYTSTSCVSCIGCSYKKGDTSCTNTLNKLCPGKNEALEAYSKSHQW